MTSNLLKVACSSQGETFLTAMLKRLWNRINAAICQAVREQVEPALKQQLPAPLNTLHFTKLDLGKMPLCLENLIVFEQRDGSVQFNVDVAWDGECEIELEGDYVGKLGIKSIKFNGRIAIILKPLLTVLPVAGAVQFYLIDPPSLDLQFTGLAEVADFPLISGTVRKVISDIIASLLVPPNRMMVKLEPNVSLFDVYQPPLGVARIHIISGEGFKPEKFTWLPDDIPDVYCILSLGPSPVWRTSCVADSLEPKWDNEYGDFLLFDDRQTLTLQAWDEDNPLDPDDFLGNATVPIHKLLQEPDGTMKLELNSEGKCTGAFITLRCELLPLTKAKTDSLSSQKVSPYTMGGVLTVLVKQASGIPPETSTFVKVTYGKHVYQTPTIAPLVASEFVVIPPGYDPSTPSWDSIFHVPITTKEIADHGVLQKVVLQLSKPSTLMTSGVLGEITIPLANIMNAPNMTITEKHDLGNGMFLEFRVLLHTLLVEGGASTDASPATAVADSKETSAEVPDTESAVPETVQPSAEATLPDTEAAVSETKQPSEETTAQASPAVAETAEAVIKVKKFELPVKTEEQPVASPPPPAAPGKVRITAVKGRGFKDEKRRLRVRKDIPDVYLCIQVASNALWKTRVIDDNRNPEWNESSEFVASDSDTISVEAFDHDTGKRDKDDRLGHAEITTAMLLSADGGTVELELTMDGHGIGAFITLHGEKVAS